MRGRVVPSLPMLMILGEELKKARERANSSTEQTRPEPS